MRKNRRLRGTEGYERTEQRGYEDKNRNEKSIRKNRRQ